MFRLITKSSCVMLAVVCVAAVRPAAADYSQYNVDSIEWLVDKSDVIAVLNYEKVQDQQGAKPEILQEIKGDSKTLRWPLIPLQRPKQTGFGPRDQYVRLVFVNGSNALLQEVPLIREMQSFSGLVPVSALIYGVTQTGELILTQSALMHAIKNRMDVGPGRPISVFATSLTQHSGMFAPSWFPLNTTSEYYVVSVPWDTHYRDAIIRLATTGDAAERMYAARVLPYFDDASAKKALEDLSQIKEVAVSYRLPRDHGSDQATDPTFTARDVRRSAEFALQELANRKAKGTKTLDEKN